jgi:serine/threonine protein kinase
MVTPHDHAKVLDLGLAIVQGEKNVDRCVIGGQGYIVGTMDYIAPEQADDASKATPRSDIYSLGCTLYSVLTGRPPFPGGTNKEKIHRQRTEEPPPLEQLNPSVPAAFAAVVRRMMAKDPAQRYPSAAAVEEELMRWAEAESVLPLDAPGDDTYAEAVARLETAEPSAEVVAEAIVGDDGVEAPLEVPPSPSPVPARAGRRRRKRTPPPDPLALVGPGPGRSSGPITPSTGLLLTIAIGSAVLVLGGLTLLVLLVRWFVHKGP